VRILGAEEAAAVVGGQSDDEPRRAAQPAALDRAADGRGSCGPDRALR
jgi:hypothetical protein